MSSQEGRLKRVEQSDKTDDLGVGGGTASSGPDDPLGKSAGPSTATLTGSAADKVNKKVCHDAEIWS